MSRSPLGVMPRWRWLELRARDLAAAIYRQYSEAGIPSEHDAEKVAMWVGELAQINAELKNRHVEKPNGETLKGVAP